MRLIQTANYEKYYSTLLNLYGKSKKNYYFVTINLIFFFCIYCIINVNYRETPAPKTRHAWCVLVINKWEILGAYKNFHNRHAVVACHTKKENYHDKEIKSASKLPLHY